MLTQPTMHPALFERFDRDRGSGGSAGGRYSNNPERREDTGQTDSQGNYRNDNVWRSASSNKNRGDNGPRSSNFDRRGPRDGGFDRGAPRDGGFRKPWENRDGGSDRGAPRDGGFRKPWEKRDGGFDRGAPRDGGFRKPWEKRDGGFDRGAPRGGGFDRSGPRDGGFDRSGPRDGGFDRGAPRDGGFRKPWEKRDGGSDRGSPAPKAPATPQTPEGELLFGRQPVREMLRANRRVVRKMIFTDGIKESDEVQEIKNFCAEREIKIEWHTRETLNAWLNAANHQGVLAVCEEYPYAELDEIVAKVEAEEGNAIVVILDHVVDPQNLGSLLRTCETAGVLGVVLPVNKAVGVTPAAVRASAGAAEHLPVARVSNLVSVIERFKGINVWSTGLESLPESKPYTAIDYTGKVCIIIGSEGHGLSSPVRGKCDNLASLPMFGKVSSLNAGVAGAIALYEVIRQQNG